MDASQSMLDDVPPQPPTTYTMRCPWSVPIPANRPARVVANAEQLAILKALYARTGEDATKDDIGAVSRETGLQEKWIRKWIKRQRAGKRSKRKKITKPQVPQDATVAHAFSGSPGNSDASGETTPQSASASLSASMRPVFDLHSAGPAWHSPLGHLAPASGSSAGDSPSSGSGTSSTASVTQASPPHASLTVLPRGLTASANAKDSLTGTMLTTPVFQVVQPGASFTVPLRLGTASVPCTSAQSSLYKIPPGEHPPSADVASPKPGYRGPDFPEFHAARAHSSLAHSGFAGDRAHTSHLTPLHIPSGGYPTQPHLSNSPYSAPPSAFSSAMSSGYSGFAGTMGNSYFYRLLNESAASNAPDEAPPLHPTHFLGDNIRPAHVPPELWSPLPGFLSPVAPGDGSGYGYPATPVSYQMRMSDLVALTKHVRAVAAGRAREQEHEDQSSDEPTETARPSLSVGSSESATEINPSPVQRLAQGDSAALIAPEVGYATQGGNALATPESGDETDDDEDEVVTPCEEVELFLPNDHPMVQPDNGAPKDKEVYRSDVAIADGTLDEAL
ncbi:hypothetical protein OH77DRAFT_1588397 [Trametes cingulata]|nr:hypothetical protein OH77DRAFT_1588397 [Trametes cingulata]